MTRAFPLLLTLSFCKHKWGNGFTKGENLSQTEFMNLWNPVVSAVWFIKSLEMAGSLWLYADLRLWKLKYCLWLLSDQFLHEQEWSYCLVRWKSVIMFHFMMESCFEMSTLVLLKEFQTVPFVLSLYVGSDPNVVIIIVFCPVLVFFSFLSILVFEWSSLAFVFAAFGFL